MPTNHFAHLITLETRLADEIAALEASRAQSAPKPPAPPPGMRWFAPPKHALLDQPALIRMTFARQLFWRGYLAHRVPTAAGIAAVARRVRGMLLYGLALVRESREQPLPLRHSHQHVPAWALKPLPPRNGTRRAVATVNRAAGDDDPVEWWAENGDGETDLSEADIAALAQVVDVSQIFGEVPGLTLNDALSELLDLGYSEMDILQLLDAAWNGQAARFAGQDTLDGAGITGAFDLKDPWFSDYMRQQAGYLITNIDESTRRVIANLLWGYTGGFTDLPQTLSVDALARRIREWNAEIGNELADISSARAYLIAVTEMARAESFGSYAAMWLSGVQQKIWIITAGACLICMGNAEAGPIALDESFPGLVLMPPQHPRCRCSASGYIDASVPFNPNDWLPRDPGPLMDYLSSWEGAVFPNVPLRARRHIPHGGLLGPVRHGQPHATSEQLTALGEALRQVAATAAQTWAHAAGVRVPTTEAALRALSTRESSETRAADSAYWHAVTRGMRAAARQWRSQL